MVLKRSKLTDEQIEELERSEREVIIDLNRNNFYYN
jgi:hypothetical protein